MLLCYACSATLDGPSLPSHTEKAEAPPTSLNCGQHVVCGACARRTPSLARSCILCSPVLPPPPASKLKEIGAPPPLDPFYAVLPPDDGEFVLGGNSDDEDGEEAPPMVVSDEAPPSYVDEEGFGTKLEEKGGREQSTLHYLKPEETLAGLALRYGVPVRTCFFSFPLPPILSRSCTCFVVRLSVLLSAYARTLNADTDLSIRRASFSARSTSCRFPPSLRRLTSSTPSPSSCFLPALDLRRPPSPFYPPRWSGSASSSDASRRKRRSLKLRWRRLTSIRSTKRGRKRLGSSLRTDELEVRKLRWRAIWR